MTSLVVRLHIEHFLRHFAEFIGILQLDRHDRLIRILLERLFGAVFDKIRTVQKALCHSYP